MLFLSDLRAEVEAHRAVDHPLLNRCASGSFERADYRIFGENHYPLVCVFTSYLERLLVRAPTSDAKLWLAKVLVDEYGEGSDGEDHATLYAHFLRSCGSRAPDEHERKVPVPAHAFIEEHRRIVNEEPFLVGLGAVGPGHEWAIPRMFAAVIPGLQRAGFSEKEILYFTLHVAQDVDHGRWLEQALERFGSTAAARAQIRRGALLSLEARRRLWSGIERALRPNGPPFVRALESRIADLGRRFRPSLRQIIEKGRE